MKQIFCSNLTGLSSVLNFKGTAAELTEILYGGKKNISTSPDFLFPNKFRHYFRNAIQRISIFDSAHFYFRRETFNLPRKCMSFSVNGISLRPGEVEMKILQSWRQARPRPNPFRVRSPFLPKIKLSLETQIESLLAG